MEKSRLLARLEELRKEKQWSKAKLNEEAGLTYGTIYQWYRTDWMPTINNLESVCNALGVSLSEFFAYNSQIGFLRGQELFVLIDSLSDKEKKMFLDFLRSYLVVHPRG